MTELTAAVRLGVQQVLEGNYEASIQHYRHWAEDSKQDPANDIATRMADETAEKVATAETLMGQFGKEVATDKLTLAERVEIEGHLRKNRDRFTRIYGDKELAAGIKIAEAEVLLKNFNTVTQRKRAEAIPKSTYKTPPVPPMGGCR